MDAILPKLFFFSSLLFVGTPNLDGMKITDNQPTLREGFREKKRIFYGLLPNRGGSARVVKKPYCFFEKVFFQRAYRIILGPPKHVLHLVWSPFVIYTAIRTALKEA